MKNQHLLIGRSKTLLLSDIEQSGNTLNLVSVGLNDKGRISQEIRIKAASGGSERLPERGIVTLKKIDRLYAVRL